MMLREPVLISTVTAMPGERLASVFTNLHLCPIERDTRSVAEFLAFGFAARAFRTCCFVSRLVRSEHRGQSRPEIHSGPDHEAGHSA